VKIAYDSLFKHALPAGHRFPMDKYELIPGQLLHEGTVTAAHFFAPAPCPAETILLTHEEAYWQRLLHQQLSAKEQREIGFPQSPELTHRERVIVQGTIDCCRYALETGIALNIAGGTHHAFAHRGEGFCLLNDMAIAANDLLLRRLAKRILIIDLDVHQGNGTARLFADEPNVFTFSMHGAHTFPFRKEKSDCDIPLKDGTDDNTYLGLLQDTLPRLIEQFRPDFAFYLSGVDILDTDKFGKLNVSLTGCRDRDGIVYSLLHRYQIPCTTAMGGGYSPDIRTIVEAHCNTFRMAAAVWGV
jgi:acetoin utilization deacetylase AcuC-like enzyme